MASLWAKKSIEQLRSEAAESEHSLRRALGPLNLVTLGIGAIIGAGIFVITGQAAAQFAGPAILISFVLAGMPVLLQDSLAVCAPTGTGLIVSVVQPRDKGM